MRLDAVSGREENTTNQCPRAGVESETGAKPHLVAAHFVGLFVLGHQPSSAGEPALRSQDADEVVSEIATVEVSELHPAFHALVAAAQADRGARAVQVAAAKVG